MSIENGTLITVRDARLTWRNFEGRATKYKEAGPDARSFGIVLDEELAREWLNNGLNVRTKCSSQAQWVEYRDAGWNVGEKFDGNDYEDQEPRHTLQVAVGYKIKPPRVTMITSNGRVNLGEDTVSVLDWADIEKVDLIFRANHWSNPGGKGGVKCWLKTIFVTINEDELEAEYGINDVSTETVESLGVDEDDI